MIPQCNPKGRDIKGQEVERMTMKYLECLQSVFIGGRGLSECGPAGSCFASSPAGHFVLSSRTRTNVRRHRGVRQGGMKRT